jgi:hypothetical protein
MAGNKTKPTGASVEAYIASRANAQQRSDCRELMHLLERITRQQPRMWGPSMVGYGSYRYTYESGRTGEAPVAGFAIRGRELVVYVLAESDEQKSLLSRLGKHRMGKVCLYFKQLADLDTSVLRQLVTNSIAEARRRYGCRAKRLMNTKQESFATRPAPTRLFSKPKPPMFLPHSSTVSQPNTSGTDRLRGNGAFERLSRTSLMTNSSARIESA